MAASEASAAKLAQELGGIHPSQVLVCSTGVIGAPLRVEKILDALPQLVRARHGDATTFDEFSRAIMTTDTRSKWAAAKCRVGGVKQVRILGCAKGSGMIHPRMATMLAFLVATDAAVPPALLSRLLRAASGPTFNSITVDGDTSTNDTVMLLANGESGGSIKAEGEYYKSFGNALESVCKALALAIVADGEGAQRVIEVEGFAELPRTRPPIKSREQSRIHHWSRQLLRARIPTGGVSSQRPGTRECRLTTSGWTFGSRESKCAAVGGSIRSTNKSRMRKCSRSMSRFWSICVPVRDWLAYGRVTSPANTSTLTPATALRKSFRHSLRSLGRR